MKPFDWNPEKNLKLMSERGISFEDVVIAVDESRVLDSITHPDPKRYPGQKLMIVEIRSYACAVPYVEDDEKVFLKTVIPSRKYTKRYLAGDNKPLAPTP